jgi:UDP-GlcNAc:undecaprenyl-phosphate/decaprenyl-phosphate GlcNAc-1-phosphate transferase
VTLDGHGFEMMSWIGLSAAFLGTLLLIALAAPIARRIGLLDVPGERKCHQQPTPLVGGAAIFSALLVIAILFGGVTVEGGWFLAGGGALVIVGMIDDYHHLPVSMRIVVEVLAATMMVFGGGVAVSTVGDLLGTGILNFPIWIAYPFSAVAVFGVINALNMLDGLDGLCAGVSLACLAVLFGFGFGSTDVAGYGLILMSCLAAFLICNCSLVPGLPKVFLGDAGSKLIGFTLVWLLIEAAQPIYAGEMSMLPVTALYFIGLPLMDMVATTIKRVRRGVSPFHPDRTHLHHLMIDKIGLSRKVTVVVMILLALALNLLGVLLMRQGVPEVVQFVIFCTIFVAVSVLKEIYLSKASAVLSRSN